VKRLKQRMAMIRIMLSRLATEPST
jgi:hypothetical protein